MKVYIGKKSDLRPQLVIREAIDFFGPAGAGLEIWQQVEMSVRLKGPQNDVYIQAYSKNGGADVDLEAADWTPEVQNFLKNL